MAYEVSVQKRDPGEVARQWMSENSKTVKPEAEVFPKKYSSNLNSGFFSAKSFSFILEHPVMIKIKNPSSKLFLNIYKI